MVSCCSHSCGFLPFGYLEFFYLDAHTLDRCLLTGCIMLHPLFSAWIIYAAAAAAASLLPKETSHMTCRPTGKVLPESAWVVSSSQCYSIWQVNVQIYYRCAPMSGDSGSDFLACIACIAYMCPIATDVECSIFSLSFCALVAWICPAKTAQPIEVPVGGWLGWAKRTMLILDGVEIPYRKWQFWGVIQSTEKQWESLLQCMKQKGSFCGHQWHAAAGIIQSSLMAWHGMQPFIEIRWPLVVALKQFWPDTLPAATQHLYTFV